MNDLAAVLHLLERDEEAIEMLRQAIAIGKRLGVEELPTFYVNLGAIHLARDMAHLAEQACRSGLNLANRYKDEQAVKEAKHCLETVRVAREKEGK